MGGGTSACSVEEPRDGLSCMDTEEDEQEASYPEEEMCCGPMVPALAANRWMELRGAWKQQSWSGCLSFTP